MARRILGFATIALLCVPVSVVEAKKDTDGWFAGWDGHDWDGSGALDGEEFENWRYSFGENSAQASSAFARSDTDESGDVTQSEYEANLPSA